VKDIKLGVFLIAVVMVLSACASAPGKTAWYDDWRKCATAGGFAGVGGGVIVDDDDADAGAAGMAIGAAVGSVVCAMQDTDADGVRNSRDACPGTERGSVDAHGCVIDSDGDGVADGLDECPGTPAGEAVDARGCEQDSDGDGVADRLDQCPGTPAGAAVDAKGCELDADGDGVVDRLDECPNTAAGTAVDNSGCALPTTYELEGVNFEHDSATLTGDSTATLDAAVEIMTRHSDLVVEIAGHTDSRGSDDYNQGLSERRAEAVRDYLVSHGVDAGNTSVKGYGESSPVADNDTEDGRAANRRVELHQH
jgi:OOP family OmpA-OmpF porin